MNILLSLDNYDHRTGGADLCVRALAQALAARGHRVEVLEEGHEPASYDDGPVRVHTHPLPSAGFVRDSGRETLKWNRLWHGVLEEFLAGRAVQLILTQNRLLQSTVAVAAELGIPVAVLVHGFSVFCPTKFRDRDALADCDGRCKRCLPWRLRLKYRSIRRNLDAYERALHAASLVIANSHYTQQVIRQFCQADAEVVYPTMDLGLHLREDDPYEHDRVLFVKPRSAKGLPIFLEIARRMPDVRFLVVGSARFHSRRKLRRLTNVECIGWVGDMRSIYARTRILLGPSIALEPFGRVFAEAGAGGIPSVASRQGGIPEAVGEGGILIDEILDIDRWVAALRSLEDPAAYAACSARARENASRLSSAVSLRQFLEAVRKATGLIL